MLGGWMHHQREPNVNGALPWLKNSKSILQVSLKYLKKNHFSLRLMQLTKESMLLCKSKELKCFKINNIDTLQYWHLISNQHTTRMYTHSMESLNAKHLLSTVFIKHYFTSWLYLLPVLIFSKRRIKRLSNLFKKWSQVSHYLWAPNNIRFIIFLPAKDSFLNIASVLFSNKLKKKKSQILAVTVNINTTPYLIIWLSKQQLHVYQYAPSWSPLTYIFVCVITNSWDFVKW